jgi:ferric-dicitrate binding protein FerR (iron transport regulator)
VGTEKRERQKANRALKMQQVEQAQSRRKLLRKVAIVAAAVGALVLFVWIASNFVGDDEAAPAAPTPASATIDPTGS